LAAADGIMRMIVTLFGHKFPLTILYHAGAHAVNAYSIGIVLKPGKIKANLSDRRGLCSVQNTDSALGKALKISISGLLRFIFG
jgi:hypothetical protein